MTLFGVSGARAIGETGLLAWTRNRISLTSVPSYNNDRSVTGGESGFEQLRRLVREGRGIVPCQWDHRG
jgi:hypothetical protein